MAGYSLEPHALTALSHAVNRRDHNRTGDKITRRPYRVKRGTENMCPEKDI